MFSRFARDNRRMRRAFFFAFIFLLLGQQGRAAEDRWVSSGPMGGDARAFAAVPAHDNHLYLGTTNSWIYESLDGGNAWRRLAKLDQADDLIVDNLVVDEADPGTIFAAGWKLDHADGGMWISHDEGKTWAEVSDLRGQSIRSLAQAPSDPKVLVAGTLDGVYRSLDRGLTWRPISPSGSKEIREVESLAFDPRDANIIYAGTWHLPWKTANAGKDWINIKDGVIDDSDVFSIIIDPEKPEIVYASACSGIYKSESAGEHFRRIEGIPSSARRTRVLLQDPHNHDVVYAGTTEGLYRTIDAGQTFTALTGPDVIVNDVHVDANDAQRILLATDRSGVLASDDGGKTFKSSNEGFSGRKVEALLVDRKNPRRVIAGVLNDKAYGGAFLSDDGGGSWKQIADGLEGRDVFALTQAADGTVVAGTNHGIFALVGEDENPLRWEPRNSLRVAAPALVSDAAQKAAGLAQPVKQTKQPKQTRRTSAQADKAALPDPPHKAGPLQIEGRVNAIDTSGDVWLASTSSGLLTSRDKGESWQGSPVMGSADYLSVSAHQGILAAARIDGVVLSQNAGLTWSAIGIPTMLTRIHGVAFSKDGALWLAAREGVYFTRDMGRTWMWVTRLPLSDVDDIFYDESLNRILVSSRSSDQVFLIDPKTMDWTFHQTGYKISLVRVSGDRLLAASLFDGVLVQPQAPGNVETGQR
jgi:photosystem II stability/assembly factor-like uncharacterized protein